MKINNEKIHDSIISRTEKLFLRHGIRGWNMDTVASESGMAKNTLYKIIGTKEQLLEQIVIGRLRKNVLRMVDIFNNEPDFLKAADTAARHLTRSISQHDLLTLPQVFLEYPVIKDRFISVSKELSTSIHWHLNNAKESGVIRNDIDNDILISTVTAIINHFLSGNFNQTEFEERAYTALSYLVKGIMA